MNPIVDILFTVSWFVLLVIAIRQMARGFNAVGEEKSIGTYTKTVTKPVHPEMAEVKPGTELMGVTFMKEVPSEKIEDPRFKLDSPALHGDPLHQSLRDRIENGQVDDPWDNEEDDDDGGDLVVARR